jgi:chromosomal replication initiation ATPase DnaA
MNRQEEVAIIIDLIQREMGIEDILIKNRVRDNVDARRILFYILKKKLGLTLTEIGKMSNRTHATILHSVNNFKDIIKYDKELNYAYNKILDEYIEILGKPLISREEISERIQYLQKQYLYYNKYKEC